MTLSATEPEHVSHATFQAPSLQEVAGLFPNYDIYSLIACGGMGAVYHANQRSLDRDVAIKILPREFSQDKYFRVSFAAEAKSMAKLNHPNLIGVYDFGDVGGLLYIVMEYVPGSSLYSVSHGRVVHQDDALKMVINVCRGLAHAHEHGVLHRDIKPSNILIDSAANPKIGDFGLASALGTQIQEGEQIFGTPGYTAPEVIAPPHTFDHRADIFSVGIMLHEMLTGITPNGGNLLAELPAATNPKLRSVIQRAIDPNPAARHASADELAADLEKILAAPSSPQPAATSNKNIVRLVPRPMHRPKSHHRVIRKSKTSYGSLFVILILIGVIAAIYFFRIKPNKAAIEAIKGAHDQITTNLAHGAQNAPKSADQPIDQPIDQKPARRKTVAQEGVKPIDDVDAFFARVEGIMKDRLKDDLDAYREESETYAQNFETRAKQAITAARASLVTTAVADLASTMQKLRSENYVLNESLPASLANISSVQVAFTRYQAAQVKVSSRFNKLLASEQSSYINGLDKQIERYRASKDKVAIRLLEKEIKRLKSEPGYYAFLMDL
jgi:serine/threonine protein kinase